MTTYTGDILDSLAEVKRLYANLGIEFTCPKCGEKVLQDFNQDYISYGELSELNLYCYDGCEHEWTVPARILEANIIIEVDQK